MRVTGDSLKIFRTGVVALIGEVKNDAAKCSDPCGFEQDSALLNATLKIYEAQLAALRRQLSAIDRAMAFENRVAKLREVKK